jgi:hypothetical protein
LIIGALSGYRAATRPHASGSASPAGASERLEFYLTEQSFSEIENTKARLQALCAQFVTELPQLYRPISPESATGLAGSGSRRDDAEHTLELLEKGRRQFRGTQPEGYVVEEMLIV